MYFSIDGQPLDDDVAITHRQQLVDQVNAIVGAMQQDFISARMPYDAIVSYVR